MVKEFSFINLYRGLAAFWVLVAHCMIWGGWYWVSMPDPKLAVNLFMVISGFLMAANAHARSESEPFSDSRNWRVFWARRFFRIAPLYYLAIVVTFFMQSYFVTGQQALQSLDPSFWGGAYDPTLIHYTPGNIALHLSFLFGLSPEYSRSMFLPDWSIGLEMQFYFLFPLLILIMQRVGFTASAILIGVAAYYSGTYVAAHTHYLEPSLLIFSLNYFLAGMLIFRALRGQIVQHVIPIIGVFVLILIDSKFADPNYVMPILMASMLVLGFMEKRKTYPAWLASIINSRVVHFFSDTSYGVYLFHGTFIALSGVIVSQNHSLQVMEAPYRVFLMVLFVGLGAYTTAFVLHRLVELPGIAIGRKVIAWMKANRVMLPAKEAIDREAA